MYYICNRRQITPHSIIILATTPANRPCILASVLQHVCNTLTCKFCSHFGSSIFKHLFLDSNASDVYFQCSNCQLVIISTGNCSLSYDVTKPHRVENDCCLFSSANQNENEHSFPSILVSWIQCILS